jgi:hypothetical protein
VWWKPVVGGAIVLFALREMFQDLFHPSKSGALSDWIGHRIFLLLRRWPSILNSAGPLAVVVSILFWAGLLVLGFAVIYWSVFPWAFQLRTANQPNPGLDGFWWCLYYSLEMLTTLGLGDIQPTPSWLRLLSAMHTLLGFSLVTASITWVVLIYPALSRTRNLARKAHILASAERKSGVSMASEGFHTVMTGIAQEVIQARVDHIHFSILFYFYTDDCEASLSSAVWKLRHFAKEGLEPGREDKIRFAAFAIDEALDDLADKLRTRLDVEGSADDVFRAFSEFHLTVPSN